MHRFLIPDATGHSVVEFDKLSATSMKEAEELFEQLVKGEHKTAYTRDVSGKAGGKGESRVVRSHDPNAEETVFFNPLAGG